MKLRVPEGCGAVSHRGQPLEIDEDGSVDVDEEALAMLASFGFTPWNEGCAPDISEMTRDELVRRMMKVTLGKLQSIGTEDIRARLLAAAEASAVASEAEASPTTNARADVEAEIISSLNRQGLFALLRARGVSVSLPVTNEELRAAARRALDG